MGSTLMNLLLTLGVVISGILLLIWLFLSIFVDLLARTAAAPTFQFAEIGETDHQHQGWEVLTDGY